MFCWLSITLFKTEQPLQNTELQEKEEKEKDGKHLGTLIRKNQKITLFRSKVEGKHSAGKEARAWLCEEKTFAIYILITSKKSCYLSE